MKQTRRAEHNATPIVSHLTVNLGWLAWLKPFFIHPSVTAGAAKNMIEVHSARKRIEEENLRILEQQRASIAIDAIRIFVHSINKALESQVIKQIKEIVKSPSPNLDAIFHQVCLSLSYTEKADKDLSNQLLAKFKGVSPQYDAILNLIAYAEAPENGVPTLTEQINSSLQFSDSFRRKTDGIWYQISEDLPKNHPKKAELLNIISALNPRPPVQTQTPVEPQVEPYVHPSHIFQGAFLKTFGIVGYETATCELTDAQGNAASFDNAYHNSMKERQFPHIPFSLMFWTLIGAPNRLHNGKANLTLREVIRNLFGGWDSLYNPWSQAKLSKTIIWWLNPYNYNIQGKRAWNLLLLLTGVKFAIAAVNLTIWGFNLARNAVKLVIEFLPEVLLQYSGAWYGWSASGFPAIYYEDESSLIKLLIGTFIGLPTFLVSFAIHHVARLWLLVGTAFTSPVKSATEAWNYGRALNSRVGYVFALLGFAISLTLSAVLWTLFFPAALSEAMVLIPALVPIVTSISQLPVVVAALKMVNGTAILVAGTLPAAFSLASTAISMALGVTVTATTLAVTATVAFIAAYVGTLTALVADYFRYVWTQWKADSPLLLTEDEHDSLLVLAVTSVLNRVMSIDVNELIPSYAATTLAEESIPLAAAAMKSGLDIDKFTESKPYYAQDPEKRPSFAVTSEPTWGAGAESPPAYDHLNEW